MYLAVLVWRSRSSSTRFSPPFSMGKWSLREAAYLATACAAFIAALRLSFSPCTTCVCVRPQFSAEKAVAFSMCTLYSSRPLEFTPVCLQRTGRATVRSRTRTPSVFACLCVYGRRKTCFGWFMWTAAPMEPCSGARE